MQTQNTAIVTERSHEQCCSGLWEAHGNFKQVNAIVVFHGSFLVATWGWIRQEHNMRLPWQARGEDSELPLQEATVRFLLGELKFHMPGREPTKKEKMGA